MHCLPPLNPIVSNDAMPQWIWNTDKVCNFTSVKILDNETTKKKSDWWTGSCGGNIALQSTFRNGSRVDQNYLKRHENKNVFWNLKRLDSLCKLADKAQPNRNWMLTTVDSSFSLQPGCTTFFWKHQESLLEWEKQPKIFRAQLDNNSAWEEMLSTEIARGPGKHTKVHGQHIRSE